MVRTLPIAFIFCCSSIALFIAGSGCAKEFSYERTPIDTTTVQTPAIVPFLSSCTACPGNAVPDSSWSFSVAGARLCGVAERSIITLERTSFTFFGPSFCSQDSGFVATVYLNDALNADKSNIHARYVSFFYYDRVKPSYVLVSKSGSPFTLTIENYSHATGLATGSFTGLAYRENGMIEQIVNGKFKIRF